ncbi:MAG: Fructosamine/Ketosamine-3-kinase [Polyangiaceae bacterium]|jgi:fructosamine-3-kinase|nr:Fructosamine/Ketosamine-3-kinase [Polyangiaceae bacterium]
MIDEPLSEALELTLGAAIRGARRLSGGDINDAFELSLANGERVFLKTNARAAVSMFPAEAHGLEWLRAAGALRIPEVLAVSAGREGEPSFLVLELLTPGRQPRDFDERLGRGLAALHRFGAERFGLERDNFIGSLPQRNRPHGSWAEFFWAERLSPQLERAAQSGRIGARLLERFERLASRLPQLVGPVEPPSRLHGDLWGGNLHVDPQGAPCLIDPAPYAGHREVDLAMMRLFGGFGERVFRAYEEAYPLAPGHAERVALYQLYPLLVHVNLFGGTYADSVAQSLARYV